jgi:hypothetical protein
MGNEDTCFSPTWIGEYVTHEMINISRLVAVI